jgi:hypothetical protein
MPETIKGFFIHLDLIISTLIANFVENYAGNNNSFFVMLLPYSIKYLFYTTLILIPLLPLKLLYPYNTLLTGIIYLLISLSAVLLFGVFTGFFQLLWTS